jgi:membrane associated rhomboid family serine protease
VTYLLHRLEAPRVGLPPLSAIGKGSSASRAQAVGHHLAAALRITARQVRQAPFSVAMLISIVTTTAILRWAVSDDAEFLEWISTNAHNLGHRPITSLVASALVIDGQALLFWGVALALVLIPVERRYGTLRTVAVFAAGHVLATLLTEVPVAIGIRLGYLPGSDARSLDVGISYGLAAVTAVAVGLIPGRRRFVITALMAGALVGVLISAPSMTAAGHVLAFSIGIVCCALLRHAPRPKRLGARIDDAIDRTVEAVELARISR